MPNYYPNIPAEMLDRKNTWLQKRVYISKLIQLAHSFILNFEKFDSQASEEIMDDEPLIDERYHFEEHI